MRWWKALSFGILLALAPIAAALADSSAQPVTPGYLATTPQPNCPTAPCFVPYGAGVSGPGMPVTDAAGLDTQGAFTGAGAGSIVAPIDGYASLKAQVKGTYAGFTVSTLVSSDGGVTYVPLQCALVDGSQFGSSFTLAANQSVEISCGHQSGDDNFKLSTAAGPATGTAAVDISASSFPSNDGTTVGIVVDASPPAPTSGIVPYVSPSLEACHVMKAGQATAIAYGVTTGATAGYLMVFNATSAPADGAVTPAALPIQVPANASLTRTYSPPSTLQLSTGFTVCFSSTGPYTKTASATAVLEGTWQ